VEQGIAAINQSIASLLFVVVLFNGIFPKGDRGSLWQRMLHTPALRNVGKYSYGIYVFHFPVMISSLPIWEKYFTHFHQLHPIVDTLARVFVAGVASYLLAWCSWHVLEQPFLKMKRFFGGGKT
jgi:peptidoglycan/LPS O-acetylase OafA/YrhL